MRFHLRFRKNVPVYVIRRDGSVPIWPAYWKLRRCKRTVKAVDLGEAADKVGEILLREDGPCYMEICDAYRQTAPKSNWEQVKLPRVLD